MKEHEYALLLLKISRDSSGNHVFSIQSKDENDISVDFEKKNFGLRVDRNNIVIWIGAFSVANLLSSLQRDGELAAFVAANPNERAHNRLFDTIKALHDAKVLMLAGAHWINELRSEALKSGSISPAAIPKEWSDDVFLRKERNPVLGITVIAGFTVAVISGWSPVILTEQYHGLFVKELMTIIKNVDSQLGSSLRFEILPDEVNKELKFPQEDLYDSRVQHTIVVDLGDTHDNKVLWGSLRASGDMRFPLPGEVQPNVVFNAPAKAVKSGKEGKAEGKKPVGSMRCKEYAISFMDKPPAPDHYVLFECLGGTFSDIAMVQTQLSNSIGGKGHSDYKLLMRIHRERLPSVGGSPGKVVSLPMITVLAGSFAEGVDICNSYGIGCGDLIEELNKLNQSTTSVRESYKDKAKAKGDLPKKSTDVVTIQLGHKQVIAARTSRELVGITVSPARARYSGVYIGPLLMNQMDGIFEVLLTTHKYYGGYTPIAVMASPVFGQGNAAIGGIIYVVIVQDPGTKLIQSTVQTTDFNQFKHPDHAVIATPWQMFIPGDPGKFPSDAGTKGASSSVVGVPVNHYSLNLPVWGVTSGHGAVAAARALRVSMAEAGQKNHGWRMINGRLMMPVGDVRERGVPNNIYDGFYSADGMDQYGLPRPSTEGTAGVSLSRDSPDDSLVNALSTTGSASSTPVGSNIGAEPQLTYEQLDLFRRNIMSSAASASLVQLGHGFFGGSPSSGSAGASEGSAVISPDPAPTSAGFQLPTTSSSDHSCDRQLPVNLSPPDEQSSDRMNVSQNE